MRIGLIGSAPSSVRLAPYSDPSWEFWGCSPGAYPVVPRSSKWFELHRWEPGVVGQPATQKPWFSPEYCLWLARHPCVVMAEAVPEVPNSVAIDVQGLTQRYGSYFFTSSLAWMFAMAIDAIREKGDEHNQIGLWGVDMAATEEYGYQRAGCQFFTQLANQLGIEVIVPPESDLLMPATLYGVCEIDHQFIKLQERKRELEGRLANAKANMQNFSNEVHFLQGAIDDTTYMMGTWMHKGDVFGCDFKGLFGHKMDGFKREDAIPGAVHWVDKGLPEPLRGILRS